MNRADILFRLEQTLGERRGAPPGTSYVASLHHKGIDAVLKKIGEEATETILAAKEGDRTHLTRESADLLFHLLVLLGECDIPFEQVLAELERREGVSGIAEKQSRTPT
ncbi:MAG TPA: phosphoribosyl-ATP diphosphatase [Usitatibacteraceae bacterium]|nr:phosphoribosyl-ATP diphosphatase [Usitatibacteraceae bacterium]